MRLARETGNLIAQAGRDLGINERTLDNRECADRPSRGEGYGVLRKYKRAGLVRLRRENAELRP